jgi:hypothetical protein
MSIIRTDDFYLFWEADSTLSNWCKTPFSYKGADISCSEVGYMMNKAIYFEDILNLTAIQHTTCPKAAKALGRQVLNFDEDSWAMVSVGEMADVLKAKFSQHERSKKELLGTDVRTLVEASPVDKVWGSGVDKHSKDATNKAKWTGLNRLGYALEIARDWLHEHPDVKYYG